jgi:hypothetical protein
VALPLGIPGEFGGPDPVRGDLIRVTGHFDDPLAGSCTATAAAEVRTIDPAFLELFCREKFVVTALEVIGHRELAPLP